MTDIQLYLAIGVPSFVALTGILVNGLLYHMLAVTLNARMSALEGRMVGIETKLDLLTGKVMEMDTRLSVLEDRSRPR